MTRAPLLLVVLAAACAGEPRPSGFAGVYHQVRYLTWQPCEADMTDAAYHDPRVVRLRDDTDGEPALVMLWENNGGFGFGSGSEDPSGYFARRDDGTYAYRDVGTCSPGACTVRIGQLDWMDDGNLAITRTSFACPLGRDGCAAAADDPALPGLVCGDRQMEIFAPGQP